MIRKISVVGQRNAFTLLETLAALAILGLVVPSVSASLHLYWKYRSISRDQITAAQLQRGLIEDLTSDLRLVSLDPTSLMIERNNPDSGHASNTSGQPSVAGNERFLDVHEQFLSLQSDRQSEPVRFVGTSVAFAVLVQTSSPRFDQLENSYQPVAPRHVVWSLNNGALLRLPLSHLGPQLLTADVTVSKDLQGLVRSVHHVDNKEISATLTATERLVSADVNSLRLRYFDGHNWHSAWNSFQQHALPVAVEVLLKMNNSANDPMPVTIWLPQGAD